MITVLWAESGRKDWRHCGETEADALMEELITNPNVVTEDIHIFFEDSFGTSCYGDTYNLPAGTKVRIISEGQLAVIKKRHLTDIGVMYDVAVDGSGDTPDKVEKVYDRNIEVISEEGTPQPAEAEGTDAETTGVKRVWARIGTTFELTGKEYEELAQAIRQGNGVRASEILYASHHYPDGNSYLPADCDDNPNEDDFEF